MATWAQGPLDPCGPVFSQEMRSNHITFVNFIAVIYDFIIKPPEPNKGLLQKEIRRIVEIGKDCMNKGDVKEFLEDLMSDYDWHKLGLDDGVLKSMESFLGR